MTRRRKCETHVVTCFFNLPDNGIAGTARFFGEEQVNGRGAIC